MLQKWEQLFLFFHIISLWFVLFVNVGNGTEKKRGYLFCKRKGRGSLFWRRKRGRLFEGKREHMEERKGECERESTDSSAGEKQFSNPGFQCLSRIRWMSSLASLGASTADAMGSFQIPNNAHKRSFEDAAFFPQEFNFRKKKDLVENSGPTLFAISFSFICSSNPQCLIYVRLELTVYLFRDLKLHWCDEVKLQADAVSRVLTSTWWWGRSDLPLRKPKPIQRFLEKVVKRIFYKYNFFSWSTISLSTEVR